MKLEELIAYITKVYTDCDLHRPAICVQIGDQIAPCEKIGVARSDNEDEGLLVFICSDKGQSTQLPGGAY